MAQNDLKPQNPVKSGIYAPAQGVARPYGSRLALRREVSQAAKDRTLGGPEQLFFDIISRCAQGRGLNIKLLSALQQGIAGNREQAAINSFLAQKPEASQFLKNGDTFEQALDAMVELGRYDIAQKMLDERAKTMREFFDTWSKSLRENAEQDKKASIRARKKARAQKAAVERAIEAARQQVNGHMLKLAEAHPSLSVEPIPAKVSASGTLSKSRTATISRGFVSDPETAPEGLSADSFNRVVTNGTTDAANGVTETAKRPAPEAPDPDDGIPLRKYQRLARSSTKAL